MRIKHKKDNLVEFVSVVDGLSSIEECVPKKSIDYMPDWWHKTPIRRSSAELLNVDAGNIKNCPGIKDYFAEGYILPMWTDLILYYDSDVDEWGYRVSDEKFKVSTHSGNQYLDYVNHQAMGENSYFIFKLASPWKIFTPKGYSSYQLPAFYHFNKDFSAAPGVRDTDRYHQLNLQLLIHSDKKEIFIPVAVGIIGFLLVVGITPLNFHNIGWLSKGDALFDYSRKFHLLRCAGTYCRSGNGLTTAGVRRRGRQTELTRPPSATPAAGGSGGW
jgi:hypothetical protein